MLRLLFGLLLILTMTTLLSALQISHLQDEPPACTTVRLPVTYLTPGMNITEGWGSRKITYRVDNLYRRRDSIVAYLEDSMYFSNNRQYSLSDQVTMDPGQRIGYRIIYYLPRLEQFSIMNKMPSSIKFKLPEGKSELRTKLESMSEEQIKDSDLIVEATCQGLVPVDIQSRADA